MKRRSAIKINTAGVVAFAAAPLATLTSFIPRPRPERVILKGGVPFAVSRGGTRVHMVDPLRNLTRKSLAGLLSASFDVLVDKATDVAEWWGIDRMTISRDVAKRMLEWPRGDVGKAHRREIEREPTTQLFGVRTVITSLRKNLCVAVLKKRG